MKDGNVTGGGGGAEFQLRKHYNTLQCTNGHFFSMVKFVRVARLMLIDSSVMYLRPNTHIMFSHNHDTYVVYDCVVYTVNTRGNVRCFYQFDEMKSANLPVA